jgi:site-specific recombinase XerD
MSSELVRSPIIQAQPVPAIFAGQAQSERRFWEFFTTQISNDNTRKAYFNAVRTFSAWCQSWNIGELSQVEPIHIAGFLKVLEREERSAPTIKQHLAALRMLFDWLVVGQVIPLNPAHAVRGPKYVVKKGKTPVLTAEEARALLDKIEIVTRVKDEDGRESDEPALVGLRDRALIGVMVFTFARVNAVLQMKVRDYFMQGRRGWVRLHEKGGKEHEVPCHHSLEQYLDEYIAAAGIAEDADGPLFRTTGRKTGEQHPMWQQDAYRMIQRRARAAGIGTRIGNHTFRATGITTYLKNSGTLEMAQHIASHDSPRTTKLYDRREEAISLDEVERINI